MLSFNEYLNEKMISVGNVNKQPDPIDMQIDALSKKIADAQVQISKYREQMGKLKQQKATKR
jgi:flagellar biosynthesis chaperone FliJ